MAHEKMFLKWATKKTRKCPTCKVVIEKVVDGSCNHMICGVCHTEFCWLCGEKIPPFGHFAKNNIRGCPGLQFGVDDMSAMRRFGAKAQVVGVYAGKGLLVTLAIPLALAVAVPIAAVVGVQVARKKWRRRESLLP